MTQLYRRRVFRGATSGHGPFGFLKNGLRYERSVFITLVLALTFAAAAPLLAQQGDPEPELDLAGLQSHRSYLSLLPFEHIDPSTGSLILTFDELLLKGNGGFDLLFRHTYNSKTGTFTQGIAGIPLRVSPFAPVKYFPVPRPPLPDPPYKWALPVFGATANGEDKPTFWREDVENTDILITSDFELYEPATGRLRLPNGLTATYQRLSQDEWSPGVLTEVRDAFDNVVTIDLNTGAITQHFGSVQQRSITWTSGNLSANDRTWAWGGSQGNLEWIQPPVGPSWSFSRPTGNSLRVTTPNGGTVTYEFRVHDFQIPWRASELVSTAPSVVLAKRTVAGRGIQSAEWLFDFSAADDSLTVTNPDSTTLQFENVWRNRQKVLWKRHVRQGQTELETETVEYEGIPVAYNSDPDRSLVHRHEVSSRSVSRGGRQYTTTYLYSPSNYGDYARPWQIVESGDDTRTTTVSYKHDTQAYRPGLVTNVAVKVGASGETFTRSYQYNSSTGFMEGQTKFGVTTSFQESSGNVAVVKNGEDEKTEYSYEWGTPKTIKTPEYEITRTVNETSTVASETRRGFTTSFEYDALDRRTWRKPAAGHWFETVYDNASGASVTERRSGNSRIVYIKTSVDGFGRPTGTLDAAGVTTTKRYDAYGRVVFESLPFVPPYEVGVTTLYDPLGRIVRRETGDRHRTHFSYSEGTHVTVTEENSADPDHPDPAESRVTTQEWDAFGSPDEGRLARIVDAKGGTWVYSYNSLGRLTRVLQPGGTERTWTYGVGLARDVLAAETHPESGTIAFTEYDGAGRLTRKNTPRGEFIYTYDDNGRLTHIDAPLDGHEVTMHYDESDNRTLLQNGSATIVSNYDGADRLEWRDVTVTAAGQPTRRTSFGYDGWDNLESLGYPSGKVVTYEYDLANRPTAVFRGAGANRLLAAEVLRYHASGGIEKLKYGNGIVEDYTYDGYRYWLENIIPSSPPGPLSLTYDYYPVGNVKTITNGFSGTYNQSFEYDKLDRLETITGFGATTYQYDPLGNRTRKSNDGFTGLDYQYSPQNRLSKVLGSVQSSEVGEYEFDPAGALTKSPGPRLFTYTPFDMLKTADVSGVTTSYGYDGDGQRVFKMAGGVSESFIRADSGQILSEWQDSAWRRDYIYLGSRLVTSVASATVTPPGPPTITVAPVSQSVAPGRVATFSATATGWPIPIAQWEVSVDDGETWTEIAGATGSTYSLTVARRDNGKRFRVRFANVYDYVTSADVRLTVWGPYDFDADGTSDLTVFRPTTGYWHVKYSGGSELNLQFGSYADIPVAADYDGDGLTDIAVFRPSNATWYVRHSPTSYSTVQWGGADDIPVRADYDGDGRTDFAVFRPADHPGDPTTGDTGAWYVNFSGGTAWAKTDWGREGDIPVAGDYDGDGKADAAVYRPTEARWYIRNSGTGTTTTIQWGGWGDIPLAADFDADGRTDITVFRPVASAAGGGWYFTYSTGLQWTSVTWGGYGDIPVPNDYDDDGFADVAVFRPSDATWYLRYSGSGATPSTQWGANGDFPAPAPVPSWKSPMYW